MTARNLNVDHDKKKLIREHFKDASFLAGKAGSFSGVPLRTVQSWVEKGLLTPEIADTTGTGSKRLFNLWNCIEIGIIKSLAGSRISMKLIKGIMDDMRDRSHEIETMGGHKLSLLKYLSVSRQGVMVIGMGDTPEFLYLVDTKFHDPEMFRKNIDEIFEKYNQALIINIRKIADNVLKVIG